MTEVVPPTSAPPRRAGGATFGGVDRPPAARGAGPAPGPDYAAVHASAAFTGLRRRFRRFVFPVTGLFLAWYLTYVLLAAYAPDLMATRVAGSITVGLLLGLGQFATTLLITLGYTRWARTRLDPLAAEVRAAAEEAP
ncbi:DUF485 domain-containing protein [Actinokineospora spheciospongiae]|uniref:DUF485 domain-containing protein n=1 Tax=Actinokineospora spheciospongiae TaxID=909613 RepID=UPI000D70F467|nr:DUF485 domain-containing protein [Actinokineospora spheciospongiae]PWW62677.1 uncharacterized membrane protein (DUF485 family) [Actinokineospora spheciospongiae]